MIVTLAVVGTVALVAYCAMGGDADYLMQHGRDLGQLMERGTWVIL